MLNKRGSTLIETLFAFQVYLCIIIVLIFIVQNLNTRHNKLKNFYNDIIEKEEMLLESDDIYQILDKVLR